MDTLTAKRCKPCEGGVPALSRAEAEAQLRQLAARLADQRRCQEPDARIPLCGLLSHHELRQRLAHVANIEDHHPDLEVGYDYCRVRYTTHSIGGLSENDFICAAKIDLIATK